MRTHTNSTLCVATVVLRIDCCSVAVVTAPDAVCAGKPIEITVLGGSISTGAVASRKQAAVDPNDLWSLVRIYMQKNIDGTITFTNNARSATRSYITSLCLEKFLDDSSDLVFVEFIANDGSEMDVNYTDNQKARFFERFLRNIMRKPKSPAVVMMQVRQGRAAAAAAAVQHAGSACHTSNPAAAAAFSVAI